MLAGYKGRPIYWLLAVAFWVIVLTDYERQNWWYQAPAVLLVLVFGVLGACAFVTKRARDEVRNRLASEWADTSTAMTVASGLSSLIISAPYSC
jgi:TctA family transporter